MDDRVEKLHGALVSALRQTRGDDFGEPVTVAEIYQQLVPYRAARAVVGFEMNADYEYALLRLLAGEGDLARIEPAEVRELLRGELESANPNVGIFREYANCDVWITAPLPWLPDTRTEARPERPTDMVVVPAAEPVAESAPAAASAHAQECAFCGGVLPAGRLANFCPYCGNDLTRLPCPSCGEVLEPRWRFCANCGTAVDSYDSEAN